MQGFIGPVFFAVHLLLHNVKVSLSNIPDFVPYKGSVKEDYIYFFVKTCKMLIYKKTTTFHEKLLPFVC